ERLRKSEERYKTLFDTSPDAIVVFNSDFRITGANSAAFSLFAYSSFPEVEGRPIADFVVPEERARLAQDIRTFRELGYIRDLEYTLLKKDEALFPAWARASLLREPGGGPPSVMIVIRDLSERKKLQEQLFHAHKLEAVGTLTGGIAHDFNNILTAVIGFASLCKMEVEPDSPIAYHIDGIIAAAERGSFITRQLLFFSRKQAMLLRPLNINDVLTAVQKLLARLIPENISLSVSTPKEALTVMADSTQIDQILMNLASNAKDAMPEGGNLSITTAPIVIDDEFVSLHGFGVPGQYALITVGDTGHGMDERTRSRLFEPFFTTKDPGSGSGLGLSVVYGIVREHKGYIDVSSQPGEGTNFRIYLPLTDTAAEPSAEPVRLMAKGPAETVLVAEDDQALRKFFTMTLEKFGYKVLSAEDGEEAISVFSENRGSVSLLLLDIIMPRKNGIEAYKTIQAIKPTVKAVFVSGYLRTSGEALRIPEGCDFLPKPVSPLDLVRKVREVLDRPVPDRSYEGAS
ncbi:MAG: PAS domain S-box protein, partial [Nitrospirales bacterium]|nr:PAS domain S-box protein [Nitrospirales bacterium]